MVRRSNDFRKQSIKRITEMTGADFKGMTRADVAKQVSILASAANKRITRLEKAGQPITDTVDRFSVAGKSRNELLKEFRRVKQFLQAENQSLRGQAIIARKTFKGLAQEKTGYHSGKQFKNAVRSYRDVLGEDTAEGTPYYNFWKAYDRLKETNKNVAEKRVKYRVLSEQLSIMQSNPNISMEDLHARMTEIADDIYKEVQQKVEQDTPKDAFELEGR